MGLPEGFEGWAYTFFVDEMFDPCNALTLCAKARQLNDSLHDRFFVPLPTFSAGI